MTSDRAVTWYWASPPRLISAANVKWLGLSAIGNGSGNEFLLHNGLLVDATSEQVLGVAGQTVHYRKVAPKQENNAQRMKREPKGKKPIEGVLYTSLPVGSFDDARMVIRYYELRWLIEQYHKALKTGCRIEDRALHSADRLEAMVGLVSVVAVRLLRFKTVARAEPDRPAKSVVLARWLLRLKAARKNLRRVHDLTIYEFYRELAKLGGFLGRKSEGEPGWITIWRGWEKLNILGFVSKLLFSR